MDEACHGAAPMIARVVVAESPTAVVRNPLTVLHHCGANIGR